MSEATTIKAPLILYQSAALAVANTVARRVWIAWILSAVIALFNCALAFWSGFTNKPQFAMLFATPLFNGLLTLSLGVALKQIVSSPRYHCVPVYPHAFVLSVLPLFVVFLALPGFPVLIKEGATLYCQYLVVNGAAYLFYLSLLFGRRPWLRSISIYLLVCLGLYAIGGREWAAEWLFFQYGEESYLATLWSTGTMILTICIVDTGFSAYLKGPVGGTKPGGTFPMLLPRFNVSAKRMLSIKDRSKPLWWWYRYGLIDPTVVNTMFFGFLFIIAMLMFVVLSGAVEKVPTFFYGANLLALSTIPLKLLIMFDSLDGLPVQRLYLQSQIGNRELFFRELARLRLRVSLIIFIAYIAAVWLVGWSVGVNAPALPVIVVAGYCASTAVVSWLAVINPRNKVALQTVSVATLWLTLVLVGALMNTLGWWHGGALQYGLLFLVTGVLIVVMYNTWLMWSRTDMEFKPSGVQAIRTMVKWI